MSTPKQIALVIACGPQVYEQTKALFDGAVKIANCSTKFALLGPGEMLFRSFEDPAFNVAELSFANYVYLRAQGNCPYVALPVYAKKSFVHAFYYVRTDRGIAAPGDLRGLRIGISEYQHTAYVWSRGLLQHEYGVAPADVKWVSVAGKHAHGGKREHFQPPAGVSIEHVDTDKSLSEMLEQGDIDALISPTVPACFEHRAPRVARLFPDHEAAEEAYFARTGIYPIFHVMGARNELVRDHPALAKELYRAYVAAKDLGIASEIRSAALPNAAAELAAQVTRMTRMMGRDYRSYGLGADARKTLQTFLGYHHEQGLSNRPLDIAEVFGPVPLSEYAG